MKRTFVPPPTDLDKNLGLAQQCWHMSHAACQELGLVFNDISPTDIREAVQKLKREIRNLKRKKTNGRIG